MGMWAVGVDLGGTNVRAAEVGKDGKVGFMEAEPVDHDPAWPAFGQLIAVVERLLARRTDPPVGIGLGVTGPVDPVNGIIANPYSLPMSYQGFVREVLEDRFGLPVGLENDADVAALAEARFGAGRDRQVLVCITVGTGIGVGVSVHGQLHRGAAGTHPEAGHLAIDPSGPGCFCGARGCIESLASGTAVANAGVAAGVITSDGTAKDVHEAAAAGDPKAAAIVIKARRALAIAARNLVAVHAADTVVFSGNALGDVHELVTIVNNEVAACPFGPPRGVMVTVSQLEGSAGCIGAACLVLGQ